MDFTLTAAGDILDQPAILLTILILTALAVAYVVRTITFALLRRLVRGTAGSILVERLCMPALIWLFVLFLGMETPFVEAEPAASFHERFTMIVFIAALGATLLGLMHVWADHAMRRFQIDVADNLAARKALTRMRILRRMGASFIGVITVAAMLMAIPGVRNYGVSLFASAGAAGIVLGLAARPVLSNLLAGLQIALTQPIRIDDVVIVEGEWGWIEEITATYVVVRIWDWRRLVVPLSYFIENPFQNWTRESASIIGSVFWEVDYTVPVAEMRARLKTFLAEHPLWDKNVVTLQITDSRERTMTLRALMSARNSSQAWDLRCDIREQMITWLQAEYPNALPRIRAEVSGGGDAPSSPRSEGAST